jgi:predicted membrane protein
MMKPDHADQNAGVNGMNNHAWRENFRQPGRTGGKGVFWGVVFILAAVAIALNATGVIALGSLKSGDLFWTIVLLVILVLSLPHRFWFGIFFPLIGLFFIYAAPLGVDIRRVSLWVCFLVALLLSIGFSILFHGRGKGRRKKKWVCQNNGDAYDYGVEFGVGASEQTDANIVRVGGNFCNIIKYINSENLERVEAECNFGTMKLYFDNAKPRESGSLIVLEVNFGSVELFIPRAWGVNNDLRRSFSGIYEKNTAHTCDEKTAHITVTGEANFSSVSIIYI